MILSTIYRLYHIVSKIFDLNISNRWTLHRLFTNQFNLSTNKLISDETIFRDFACFGISITNSRQEIIIEHFKVFYLSLFQSLSILISSRARRSQAVCADDCVDECYIECQENHLELIYDFDASRHRSVREYFNNRSAFDKK